MLRITELRLPLDHAHDALRPAIVERLGIGHSAVEKHVRRVFNKLGLPETDQHHTNRHQRLRKKDRL